MSGDYVEYNFKADEVLKKISNDSRSVYHLVFDKTVDDRYDDILSVSVTHDGTRGNESLIVARMLTPLASRKSGTQDGKTVDIVWRLGTIKIREKRGVVPTAHGPRPGVAQHIQIPVRLEIRK